MDGEDVDSVQTGDMLSHTTSLLISKRWSHCLPVSDILKLFSANIRLDCACFSHSSYLFVWSFCDDVTRRAPEILAGWSRTKKKEGD